MKEKLLNEIKGRNYLKFPTCDYPNWDRDKHYECLRLVGQWPEGFTLSYKINHGVHDWILLRN